jgi:hypothetical protein
MVSGAFSAAVAAGCMTSQTMLVRTSWAGSRGMPEMTSTGAKGFQRKSAIGSGLLEPKEMNGLDPSPAQAGSG